MQQSQHGQKHINNNSNSIHANKSRKIVKKNQRNKENEEGNEDYNNEQKYYGKQHFMHYLLDRCLQ